MNNEKVYVATSGSIHPKVLDGLRRLGYNIQIEKRAYSKETDLLPMGIHFWPDIERQLKERGLQKLLDVVEVTEDITNTWAGEPGEVIKKGAVCVIVEIYTVPNLAYEIEFVKQDGSGCLATVLPHQIKPITPPSPSPAEPLSDSEPAR